MINFELSSHVRNTLFMNEKKIKTRLPKLFFETMKVQKCFSQFEKKASLQSKSRVMSISSYFSTLLT